MAPRSLVARLVSGVVLLGATAACSGETVCPAIDYGSTLFVTADAAEVVVCSVEGCSDDPERRGGPWPAEVTGTTHVLTMINTLPEVGVRLVGGDGIVAESNHRLDWKRVGGSEQCGGPAEAELDLR